MVSIELASGEKLAADYRPIPFSRTGYGYFTEERLGWWSNDNQHAFFVDIERETHNVRVVEFDTASGATRILFEEPASSFAKLHLPFAEHPIVHPLVDSEELIWLSERSGYGHLYLYDLKTGDLKGAITQGEWHVQNVLHIDTQHRKLLIQTTQRNADHPFFRDLCWVNIDTGELTASVSGPFEYNVYRPDSVNVTVTNKIAGGLLEPKGVETRAIDGVTVEAAADEILVYLNDDVTPAQYSAIVNKIITEGADPASYDASLKVIQVRLPSTLDEAVLIAALAGTAGIRFAGLNEVLEPTYFTEFDNIAGSANNPPHIANTNEFAARPLFGGDYWIDHISADKAWDFLADKTLEAVTIGVVDTGVSAEQISIAESRLQRLDILSNGTVAVADDDDTKEQASHGMWVSSFAAAYNIDGGNTLYGVNKHASVIHSDVYRKRCNIPVVSIDDCPDFNTKTYVI